MAPVTVNSRHSSVLTSNHALWKHTNPWVRPSNWKSVHLQSVTIQTNEYTAIFTNQGALLKSFQLKKYFNQNNRHPVQLVGQLLHHPLPFEIQYAGLTHINHKNFQILSSSCVLKAQHPTTQLIFQYTDRLGTEIQKIYHFQWNSYLIGLSVKIIQKGPVRIPASSLKIQWADTLGPMEYTGTNARTETQCRVLTLTDTNTLSTQSEKNHKGLILVDSPIRWAALADQFFTAILIPKLGEETTVQIIRRIPALRSPTQKHPTPRVKKGWYAPQPVLIFPCNSLSQGERLSRSVHVFLGPQDYFLLKSYHLQMQRIVNLGIFGFIGIYMLYVLRWFDLLVHNWGLAIILLALLVKLILWWPTHSSYRNMYETQRKLREIQPKIDSLKKKYPNDRQKQNQEMMVLYQQAGINPLGGCLPLIAQMPVFFALYATLENCIELRGASLLWIPDLTLKDPYGILPILMGLSMIVQQKISGQAMASSISSQQKFMMWIFPIFLTLISFQWPSGLLLYWVVANLLSIVQQRMANKPISKKEVKNEK